MTRAPAARLKSCNARPAPRAQLQAVRALTSFFGEPARGRPSDRYAGRVGGSEVGAGRGRARVERLGGGVGGEVRAPPPPPGSGTDPSPSPGRGCIPDPGGPAQRPFRAGPLVTCAARGRGVGNFGTGRASTRGACGGHSRARSRAGQRAGAPYTRPQPPPAHAPPRWALPVGPAARAAQSAGAPGARAFPDEPR